MKAVRDPHLTMGIEKTRLASLPHTEQVTDCGAVPSGRVTSNRPSSSHRYSYIATGFLLFSQRTSRMFRPIALRIARILRRWRFQRIPRIEDYYSPKWVNFGLPVWVSIGTIVTCATKLCRPAHCGSGPLVAVDAISGVEMDKFHLAVRIGLLEYLLEVAPRRVLRNVQFLGGIRQ